MANYIYGATSLIGGGTGSLDEINGTDLAENDAAIVFTSSSTYIYTLDEASGGTENSPDLISPDVNAGNKRWILVSTRASESSLNVSSFAGILDANDDDVQKALDTIDDLFNGADFTIAPGSVSLDDDVVKGFTTDSGTVTVASHSLDIAGSGKVNTTGSGSGVTIAVDDLSITTKTSAYTILATDDIVIGDCSGGDVELTLPNASTKSSINIFKKSSSNTLTINCYGSQTIEAVASFDLNDEYGCLRLISDGSNTWVRSAEMYDLTTASSSILGGVKVGDNLTITSGTLTPDFSAINTDIIPDGDNTRSLGSSSKQWKDVHVGPGSLYVNGQQVVSDDSGTIIVSADSDQNLQIKTSGSGDVELVPSGTGTVQIKGGMTILAGKNVMSSDGNAISFTDGINMNGEAITGLPAPSTGTDVATRDYVTTYASNASNVTTGTLPSNVIPDLAISTVQVVASESAMLALTTQEGDTVVRTDASATYIHNGGSAGTMADFTELATPAGGVTSVNGESGPTVVLTQDDIGNGSTYVRTQNDLTDTLKSKLDNIENNATADMTAAQILTAIKTVDGSGSGLNSDLLDDMSSSTAANAWTIPARNASADIYARYFNMSGAAAAYTNHTSFGSIDSAGNIVRNTSAGFKTSLDLNNVDNIASATGATADTLVLRDGSGDITARYLEGTHVNVSHSASTRNSDTIFYSSTDNYIRKNTATGFKTSLGLESSTWEIKTTSFTASVGGKYFVDTSSAAITVTLPASPSISNSVEIHDVASNFGTNSCTVARNSQNIMGLAEDYTLSNDNITSKLVFSNSTNGWRDVS